MSATQAATSAGGQVYRYLTALATVQAECCRLNGTKREGWHHPTVEALVLAHGVGGLVQPLPRDMRKGRIGLCFKNAMQHAMARPAYTYVEGWACKPDLIPMHHAWLLAPGGARVVDPTWGCVAGTEYLGLPLTLEYVLESSVRTGVWGVLYQDWALMVQPPDTWLRRPAVPA